MAENKQSFILYTDLIKVVEKLIIQDRESKTNYAGELFYHILLYVNDKDPIPINFIIELAFEPIKCQLKRDLLKYEVIKERRSIAGKQGGRPKKEVENIDIEKAKKANALFDKQTEAKKAVNDTVTDNVNDTVINNNKKNIGVKPQTPPPKTKELFDLVFPFDSAEFKKAWAMLVSMPKWKKKVNHALEIALKNLGKYDEEFAIELIEKAIEGNYQGVTFPSTPSDYEKWKKQKGGTNGQTKSERDATTRHANKEYITREINEIISDTR